MTRENDHRNKLLVAMAGLCMVGCAALQAAQPEPSVEVLLESSETVLGTPFYYPNGQARVTALVVTLPPGTNLPAHFHPVPLFGYMLQGELTVDYGDDVVRTYRRGDSLIEAFQHVHSGHNGGRGKAKVLVVYAGAEGVENTILENP